MLNAEKAEWKRRVDGLKEKEAELKKKEDTLEIERKKNKEKASRL